MTQYTNARRGVVDVYSRSDYVWRMSDTVISSKPTVFAALRSAFKQIGDNRLSLIAAGVAFFSMLSLFPALAALIAMLSLVADPEVVVVQLEELREVLPNDVYEIINVQIVGLVTTSADTLGWTGVVSLLVAFWSARTGVGAMMNGLTRSTGDQTGPVWRILPGRFS